MHFIDILLPFAFRIHDFAVTVSVKNMRLLKLLILLAAHLSLLGIAFPELRREYGSLAGNLLIVVLFLSPLAAITNMPLLRIAMGFRRQAGILMGYLALVHSVGYFIDPASFGSMIEPFLGREILSMDPSLLAGLVGMTLTFPLLLSSNDVSLRFFGSARWKRLHSLVYPMFVAVVIHRFFVRGSEDELEMLSNAGAALFLLGSYAALKYAVRKPGSFLFVRETIDLIGGRYQEYKRALQGK